MVNKDIIKGIYQGIGILLVFSFLGLVYAGGYHLANEILPGQFKTGNYMFNGSVQFGDDVSACSSTNKGATKYDNTGNVLMYCNSFDWVEVAATRTMHMAKMSRNATQSILNDVAVKVVFDTKEFDIGDIANTTTSKFTIQQAGKYIISANWGLDNKVNDGHSIDLNILKNNKSVNSVTSYSSANNAWIRISTADVLFLDVGDYIEMSIKHHESTSEDTEIGENVRPTMSVIQLS